MSDCEPTERPITGNEPAAQIEPDSELLARREAAEQRRAKIREDLRIAERPVVDDLRAAGVNVDSVWDFRTGKLKPSSEAVAVLLRHLQMGYPTGTRSNIAQALAVPEAAVGWPVMVREYVEADAKSLKDGLANALAATVTSDTLEQFIGLVRDPTNGSSRLLLMYGLRDLRKDPRAWSALESLADDPLLGKEARKHLGKKWAREHADLPSTGSSASSAT